MLSEDAHTQPSAWCRTPQRWHAPDAQGTETEISALIGALVRALQPDFVLETGAYHGQTTERIGEALQWNGHGYAHSLEKVPDRAGEAAARVDGLPITVVCVDSAGYTPPESIGLAFLDSEPHLRAGEVARFWDWFEDGAIVCVHDTAPQHVAAAALDLGAMAHGMAAINLRTPRGLLIFQVTK